MQLAPIFIQICVAALMAISLFVPLVTGSFFLLTIGTMAVGAYLFAILAIHVYPIWFSMVMAIIASGVLAVLGGLLVIRMRGFAAAIATLAMAEVIQNFFTNYGLAGGAEGLQGVPLVTNVLMVVIAVVVVGGGVSYWYFSKLGIRARAIGEDLLAAECVGIDSRRVVLGVYAMAGVISGVAGVLLAGYLGYVAPGEFGFTALNSYLIPAIFGGLGSPIGPMVGSVVTTGVPQVVVAFQQYSLVVSSAVILVLIVVRKGGIVRRSRFAEVIVRRSWSAKSTADLGDASLDVPSAVPTSEARGAVVKVVEVSKHFGGVNALSDVSFEARCGEVFAIVGPNGAGKTTLLNVLSGVERLDSGNIYLDDQSVRCWPAHRAVQMGISRTFQNLRLFSNLLVGDNISLAKGLVAARWAARFVGLEQIVTARVGELAYGTQRRVEIARAIALGPRVLLLDEPTAGMTAKESDEIGELISRIRDMGVTVLLVEHNLKLVMNVADQILVLDRGKVLAQGSPDEIRTDSAVIEAYMGAATPKSVE